jgi:hypothetical protein
MAIGMSPGPKAEDKQNAPEQGERALLLIPDDLNF